MNSGKPEHEGCSPVGRGRDLGRDGPNDIIVMVQLAFVLRDLAGVAAKQLSACCGVCGPLRPQIPSQPQQHKRDKLQQRGGAISSNLESREGISLLRKVLR